jgi:phosphoglycerate kinase
MASKRTVRDIDVTGKTVLVRVDFNVPLDKKGNITDDNRIRAALPTIQYLLDHGAAIILMSHLGRPKDQVVEGLRLDPVASRLRELVAAPVSKVNTLIGPEAEKAAASLEPGNILLLENTRFEPGETSNDAALALSLAGLADLYVNDAFGAAHRAHASTEGVAHHLPAVAGLLMQKELDMLGRVLSDPAHPFTAILGGNKVSDKLGVIENLLGKVDNLLTGGGMCFTLMKAEGTAIGKSVLEDDQLVSVKATLEKAAGSATRLCVPEDIVVAERFEEGAPGQVVDAGAIPDGWMGLDIGPRTVEAYRAIILESKTIFWNGPMGVFEWKSFEAGTLGIARAIADSQAVSVIGGGDSAAAIAKFGLSDKMTFISTGGGASMEFLEGKELPGVAALNDA